MNEILVGALAAAGGAIVYAIVSKIAAAAKNRIRPSPEAEAVAKMAPAVNMFLGVMGPMLDLVIAIGEKDFGADAEAVTAAKKQREDYQKFVNGAAQIKVAC